METNQTYVLPDVSAVLQATGYSSLTVEDYQEVALLAKERERVWRYGLGHVIPVLCAFGILGNFISLVVLNRDGRFRTPAFTFIRWMAFIDMAGMSFLLPNIVYLYILERPSFTSYYSAWLYAHLLSPAANWAFTCSTLLVVCMTAERYQAVCSPLSRQSGRPLRKNTALTCSKALIAGVAVVSGVIILPMCWEWKVERQLSNEEEADIMAQISSGKVALDNIQQLYYQKMTSATTYSLFWREKYAESVYYRRVYTWSRTLVARVVPLVVISVLNIRIGRRYRKLVATRRGMMRSQCPTQNVTLLLLVTALVHVVCLTPMPFVHGLMEMNHYSELWFQVLLVVGNDLEVLNAALNFYMYCLASRDFRAACRDLGRSCWRRSDGARTEQSFITDHQRTPRSSLQPSPRLSQLAYSSLPSPRTSLPTSVYPHSTLSNNEEYTAL